MSRHWGIHMRGVVVAASAVALAVAACGSDSPTSSLINATGSASPAPSTAAAPSPTSEVSPTATTATATPTPGGATPSPENAESPTPYAGPGAICTGSAENKAYWGQAASWLTFDVYCPVLPAGWFLTQSSFNTKNGGALTATYAGKNGSKIVVQEGNFCSTGQSACSPHDQVLGSAQFGDLTGSLDTLGPGLGYAIYINAGASPAYSITGTQLTQDQFVAIAAALAKVPKG